jgi:hypothetical protein
MMVDPLSPETVPAVPEAVGYVRDLLHGFDRPWFLCGGWAVDAWLGRQTRDHWDVDIAVFHHDQHAIFEHFRGWALVAHAPDVADDTTEPWNGRQLDLPAHVHVPRLTSPLATSSSTSSSATHTAFEFEFLLVERSGHDWILNRDPYITVPLQSCTRQSSWQLPAETAEVVLFYKAGGDLTRAEVAARDEVVRPQDEQDFDALLPILTGAQRSWLRESLGRVRPHHPWLTHLGS